MEILLYAVAALGFILFGIFVGMNVGYRLAQHQYLALEATINEFLAETADEVITLKRNEKGELREVKVHEHEIWQNEKGKMN